MESDKHHTLMLVQFNASLASRTFLDYASPAAAMDGVCVLYEKELQVLNRELEQLTDVARLAAASLAAAARQNSVAVETYGRAEQS